MTRKQSKGKSSRKADPTRKPNRIPATVSSQQTPSGSIKISGSYSALKQTRAIGETLRRLAWEEYSWYAGQRAEIFGELRSALSSSTTTFDFQHFQRRIPSRFFPYPLSAKGSVINATGGRFNIGAVDLLRYPTFPALYLASDKETAFIETYGPGVSGAEPGLTTLETAMTRTESGSDFSISGEISIVLDISNTKTLKPFVDLINEFKPPTSVLAQFKKIGHDRAGPITSVKVLQQSLLESNWRRAPNFYGVPANSQILGQILYLAGIEAILYPSGHTGADCLAIFPENFTNSTSYIELDDAVPVELPTMVTRLDKDTCPNLSGPSPGADLGSRSPPRTTATRFKLIRALFFPDPS